MIDQLQTSRRQADRRERSDRRRAGERRRGSDARTAVFEICRSKVHMALVVRTERDEPHKLTVRSMAWRREATTPYSETGIEELSAAFRALAAEERLTRVRARIALSGEFCVTRVVSGTSDDVARELAELEERSRRYLTLGPGTKVLAGSVQPLDARHDHALLSVANQRTLSALLEIGDDVGLQIVSIEPSLVALSRAQALLRGGSPDASLVIHLDDDRAELGICHAGRLLLDYRPGGNTDSTNVANVVARHLGRLQRYLNRNHSYLKSPIRQVYLAGDPTAVARAARQFARFKQFQVTVLDPAQLEARWDVGSEPSGPEMMAALGTALLDEEGGMSRQSPNLVEHAQVRLREPVRPILIRSLLPVAAMLLVAAGLLTFVHKERAEIGALRARLDELSPVQSRARALQLEIIAAEAQLAQLRSLEGRLPSPNWSRLLARITQSMPEDVWLEQLVFLDARSATVSGASYADGGVYDFVNYLKQVPDVAEISLAGTGTGRSPTGPATTFDLQLSLVSASESNDQEDRHD